MVGPQHPAGGGCKLSRSPGVSVGNIGAHWSFALPAGGAPVNWAISSVSWRPISPPECRAGAGKASGESPARAETWARGWAEAVRMQSPAGQHGCRPWALHASRGNRSDLWTLPVKSPGYQAWGTLMGRSRAGHASEQSRALLSEVGVSREAAAAEEGVETGRGGSWGWSPGPFAPVHVLGRGVTWTFFQLPRRSLPS